MNHTYIPNHSHCSTDGVANFLKTRNLLRLSYTMLVLKKLLDKEQLISYKYALKSFNEMFELLCVLM